MDMLDQQFLVYEETFFWISLISLLFMGAVILEMMWDYIRRTRPGWKETAANWIIFAVNTGLDYLGLGVLFVVGLVLAEPYALLDISKGWWYWPSALLVADFLYYWMHRLEHEIRILWAVHVVHHSSPEFNYTTAFRLSWLESLFEWLFFVPMILLGFGTVESVIAILIVIQYQSWIHTEKIGSLGILDKLFNTPSVHRVHHGSNPQYLDKNYGGILMIWDHLFGTYQAETKPVTYGITNPLGTANPVTINFHEFRDILKDLRRRKGWRSKFRTLFASPGAQEDL